MFNMKEKTLYQLFGLHYTSISPNDGLAAIFLNGKVRYLDTGTASKHTYTRQKQVKVGTYLPIYHNYMVNLSDSEISFSKSVVYVRYQTIQDICLAIKGDLFNNQK